ncbi:MAG: fluoride efflux transporter CrcB [Paracoccaceae bacterium]|jgi:CrcB protein
MVHTLSLVALGGAVGAMLRHLIGVAVFRLFGVTEFPLAILTVNILGSFLMGVFIVTAAHKGLGHWHPLIAIGLMGGFTTFSSFSLETMAMIERGALGHAALYIALSVGLSVGGLALGLFAARGVFA